MVRSFVCLFLHFILMYVRICTYVEELNLYVCMYVYVYVGFAAGAVRASVPDRQ